MRGRVKYLSKSFLPVVAETPALESASARALLQCGALRVVGSGTCSWLPHGHALLARISAIIDEANKRERKKREKDVLFVLLLNLVCVFPLFQEMESVQFEKCALSSLQPRALWEASGRWAALGPEMFRVQDRRGGEHVLAPTAEELFVHAVGPRPRHLPVRLYQTGLKWRDEARARAGALRSREFIMKGLLSV